MKELKLKVYKSESTDYYMLELLNAEFNKFKETHAFWYEFKKRELKYDDNINWILIRNFESYTDEELFQEELINEFIVSVYALKELKIFLDKRETLIDREIIVIKY